MSLEWASPVSMAQACQSVVLRGLVGGVLWPCVPTTEMTCGWHQPGIEVLSEQHRPPIVAAEPEVKPAAEDEASEAADEIAPATPRHSAAVSQPQKADPAPQANGLSSTSAAELKPDRAAEIDQVQYDTGLFCIRKAASAWRQQACFAARR